MHVISTVLVYAAVAATGDVEVLDFTATWCGPCRQMAPVVEELAGEGFPIRQVDMDRDAALARQHNVTAVPCFVLLVDGQEVDRIVGATSREQLVALVERANASGGAPGRGARIARGQSPDNYPHSGAPRTYAEEEAPAAQAAPVGLEQRLIASTVRLRAADPSGNSVGTGTIIDTREGEALVLTCGHIFRDSRGSAGITVDMFGPGAPQGVQAHLIDYNLESDLALVRFRPGVPVQPSPLAAQKRTVQVGERVVSVGCNHGQDATAVASQITSIGKFVGPPNFQVAGQPVEGRSGGGLFNAQGEVIGVCNAADPADNEGLFAALGSIHAELYRVGLSGLLDGQSAVGGAALASIDPPAMPMRMPPLVERATHDRVIPTSAGTEPRGFSATDVGQLQAVAGAPGGAELICIVRSRGKANSEGEVVVLENASPELLKHLAAEQEVERTRRKALMGQMPAEEPGQSEWTPAKERPTGTAGGVFWPASSQ